MQRDSPDIKTKGIKICIYSIVSKNLYIKRPAIGIAVVLSLLVIFQIPVVKISAVEIIKTFTSSFDIGGSSVNMEGEYVKINSKANKELTKYSSLNDIENELGIKLLKSDQNYNEKNTFVYYPYINSNKKLYGAMIINSMYAIGDLEIYDVRTYEDETTVNEIDYARGDIYGSPIMLQITIRSDCEMDDGIINHELEYGGNKWNISEENSVEIYHCESFDKDVLLFTDNSSNNGNEYDNEEAYKNNILSRNQDKYTTCAVFVYDGIEYLYCASIDYSKMKAFIEGLKY